MVKQRSFFYSLINGVNSGKNRRVSLYDPNFVGDIESIVVWRQANIGLLDAIGPDQRVHFANVNLVQLLHCLANLGLVGLKRNQRK